MKSVFSDKITSILYLLVVCALLIFLNSYSLLKKPSSFLAYYFSSFTNLLQESSNEIYDIFSAIKNIENFKNENMKIKEENIKLTIELSKLKEIERENAMLKNNLDFTEKLCGAGTCLKWSAGRVIGRSPNNYEKYLIINLGEKQGIKKNQAVALAEGIIIGRISETFEYESKVLLVTSPESILNSLTQSSRANGIIKGKFGTGAKLEMINQSEQLTEGDLIITSGLEDGIPKGLIIGKVSNIEESANKVFKEANVVLFADFNHIEEVFVVK